MEPGRTGSLATETGVAGAPEVTCGGSAGPADPVQRLANVTGQLIRMIRRQVQSELGPGSMAALATLARCGPMRLGDLAAREGVAPPTLTRMIAVLEEGGYVLRQTDQADRRAVQVSVTEKGAQLVWSVIQARAEVLRERWLSLPEAQQAALAAALPALESLASDPS